MKDGYPLNSNRKPQVNQKMVVLSLASMGIPVQEIETADRSSTKKKKVDNFAYGDLAFTSPCVVVLYPCSGDVNALYHHIRLPQGDRHLFTLAPSQV